jgi:hypothetical protein
MTKRGRTSSTEKLDRYYTPRWPVVLLLEHLLETRHLQAGMKIGEPCAGRGDMVEVFEEYGFQTVAGDIDPESDFPEVDATCPEALEVYEGVDWLITNPPYNASTGTATEVIQNLLGLGKPLAALLRITWIEPCSQREQLFDDTPEDKSYPDTSPDFIGVWPRIQYNAPDRKTSSNPATSAWFIWVPNIDEETNLWWWTKGDHGRRLAYRNA